MKLTNAQKNADKPAVNENKLSAILCLISAALMPVVPMLYLYARNHAYLSFVQVLIVTLVFSIASTVFCATVSFLFENWLTALIACMLFWPYFFGLQAYELSTIFFDIRTKHVVVFLAIILCATTVFLHIILQKKKISAYIPALVVSLSLGMLVLFNIFTIAMSVKIGAVSREESGIKLEFTLDNELPAPNVYWIHCDGMASFQTMERMFGDAQAALLQDLEERGFTVNKEAAFEAAHRTMVALPALLCPGLYDSELGHDLEKYYEQKTLRGEMSMGFNHSTLASARMNLEIINAFKSKGYTTGLVSHPDMYFYPITDVVFSPDRAVLDLPPKFIVNSEVSLDTLTAYEKAQQLASLLSITTLTAMIRDYTQEMLIHIYMDQEFSWNSAETMQNTDTADRSYADACRLGIEELLSLPEPIFLLVNYPTAHSPFIYDEYGNEIPTANIFLAESYPGHHKYAMRELMGIVDTIIEKDPDAVIILQGDHGLNSLSAQGIYKQFPNSTIDDVIMLWNGTMSAVRIPKKYGSLDEPLNPLNITRYLVNSFVGENYQYLDPNDSDLY